jgi:hypothetical protein
MMGIFFLYAATALRRPCYLTTDESGMGVTTSKASRALLWGEIQFVAIRGTFGNPRWVLTLGSSEKLSLNLVGYSQDTRSSLLQLLKEKTGLKQHSKKVLYKRSPQSLPPGNGSGPP